MYINKKNYYVNFLYLKKSIITPLEKYENI